MWRNKVVQDSHHDASHCRPKPINPLIYDNINNASINLTKVQKLTRQIHSRNTISKALCRVHLRPSIARNDAARSKSYQPQRRADEQRTHPGAIQGCLARIEADAKGQEEEDKGGKGLVEVDLAGIGLRWVVPAAAPTDTVVVISKLSEYIGLKGKVDYAFGGLVYIRYCSFFAPDTEEDSSSEGTTSCLANYV